MKTLSILVIFGALAFASAQMNFPNWVPHHHHYGPPQHPLMGMMQQTQAYAAPWMQPILQRLERIEEKLNQMIHHDAPIVTPNPATVAAPIAAPIAVEAPAPTA